MRDFIRHHQIPFTSLVLLLLSFYTITSGMKGIGGERLLNGLIYYIATPLQSYIVSAGHYMGGIWERYISLVHVKEENERLKEEIKRLLMENERLREEAIAVERLNRYLDFKKASPLDLTAVRIIGRDPSGWNYSVVIDKGRRDGIKRGMAVITPEGVVGRVIEVYGRSSKVLLIIDPNSAVDVILQRTRVRGIAKGKGNGRMELLYVAKEADVRPGDVVITSGLSGVFPKGLPVGIVTEVSGGNDTFFKYVEVRPRVDMGRIEELLVVR